MAAIASSSKETLLDGIAASLGDHGLMAVQPVATGPPPTKQAIPSTKNFCVTQKAVPRAAGRAPANIMVGLKSECPQWVRGSLIKWAAWENGLGSHDDALYAAKCLALATEKWNSFAIGVTFQWVADAKDATFVPCHGGDRGTTLAQSFFPNDNDLSFFLVYSGAFVGAWKENMWKVFTHELGHIMGFRHEFAMFPSPDDGLAIEGGPVSIGPQNPESVMNYTGLPPEIQQTDIMSMKSFYSMKEGADGKELMLGVTVVKDYSPM